MSDRKVEVSHAITRRFAAGDFEGVGTFFHRDAVLLAPEGWPERGPMRGREEIVRQYQRLAEDYTEHRAEISDLISTEDWIVGLNRWKMRGRHSGIESELEVWFAGRFEGDLIVDLQYYWSRDEAMRAAGLED
jgi:ketosteroid isomerase-like protein